MYKMLNLDNIVSNKKKNSSENDDWPFRMLIIGPSGSGKTNTLLHLINNFHPIDKIYLYAKDTDEKKYQYLINKTEQVGIKNDPHAFIEYSNDINDTQSYFRTPKDARLNSTHYILMKIGNKKELKRLAEELNYKPNALDKARFEFSPLGKTFSTGLDKKCSRLSRIKRNEIVKRYYG